jgi:DNA-binding IscR family transcriptional regulator
MADYAVVTMSAAARHCGGMRVSAAELATETGLPVPTVQKLVSRLTSAARADCGLDSCCSVKPHWPIVNDALRDALSQVSLIRLAEVSA